ncbi:DNA primase [Kineosporia sp. R_H_3]|uniref:DNA primase n=1 Tax=Kineosporia sp. R_H_3 TaxID=1961848 RepID=UPI000B4A8997|nr:DNA primase [Kineosporia sp. R_H_3]
MRIRQEDVELVRERSRIEEVVGEHVTLKQAGVGSMKGLCPFHDERTPSFHVRPPVGLWHCFGCSEGGDVISFVQKIDHLTFVEAVERLANRIGHTLRYEDDGGKGPVRRDQVGQRQRLVEANRVAAEFFAEQLATSPDGLAGRTFLSQRDFDREAAAHFGVGFSPRSGEALLRYLRGKAFTDDEVVAAGLAGRGQRGLYDRFRGRLMWPIRDLTGDVVGFGARRLFDDDRIEAKYLNTSDTALYKKSQVLYGVDLAKREIGRTRQVVVVEGYTDVMACHLAGVQTAVATCGTAFGADHIRIVRRLLGDDSKFGGEVVFTFDGDAAGQKAALRAFEEDQRFVAQTFIAVAADGMDPCELRHARGNEAVRALVSARQPLFEFAIRSTLAQVDLDTAEGRIQGLRAAAPVVARIRDSALRPEYARRLAGWLGMEVEPVVRAVTGAARSLSQGSDGGRQGGGGSQSGGQNGSHNGYGADRRPDDQPPAPSLPRPDPRDPVARVEREALECMLQVPQLVPRADADTLGENAFEVPAYRAVHHAILAAGGMATAQEVGPQAWAEAVRAEAPETIKHLVTELVVGSLPVDGDVALDRYVTGVVLRIAELDLTRTIGILKSRVQRAQPDGPDTGALFADLLAAEQRKISLRERIHPSI